MIISHLEKMGIAVLKMSGNFSFYDLVLSLDNKRVYAEIKNDLLAITTKNIAIEVFNPISNKESGINVTTSNIWIHIIGKEILMAATDTLKQFVQNNTPKRIINRAGDGNSRIYLYDREIIGKIFKNFRDMTAKELFDYAK